MAWQIKRTYYTYGHFSHRMARLEKRTFDCQATHKRTAPGQEDGNVLTSLPSTSMSPNFRYEKNCNSKERENKYDARCDVRGDQQPYRNYKKTKGVDTEQRVKYCANGGRAIDNNNDFRDCNGNNGNNNNNNNNNNSCCSVSSEPARKDCRRPKRASTSSNATDITCGRITGGGGGGGSNRPNQCYYQSSKTNPMTCNVQPKRPTPKEVALKCYDKRPPKRIESCHVDQPFWQHGEYVRDDCGSGIVTTKLGFLANRAVWCKTPLTTYQASHGELGRRILCGEEDLTRKIHGGPPCNVCEDVLPPCRGYYRRYSCDYSPCDDEIAYESGRRGPRTKIQRYWEPCATNLERVPVAKFAPQNMALAMLLKKKYGDIPCW